MLKLKLCVLITLLAVSSSLTAQLKNVYPVDFSKYDAYSLQSKSNKIRFSKKGKPISGEIKDYYKNGKILHCGFYKQGKLLSYKNYFQNGKVERAFYFENEREGKMIIFSELGKIKSKRLYYRGIAIKWVDYHSNGKIEFYEVYNKTFKYPVSRIYYYDNGTVEKDLKLTDKKNLVFTEKTYFENGKLKESKTLYFNLYLMDFEEINLIVTN